MGVWGLHSTGDSDAAGVRVEMERHAGEPSQHCSSPACSLPSRTHPEVQAELGLRRAVPQPRSSLHSLGALHPHGQRGNQPQQAGTTAAAAREGPPGQSKASLSREGLAGSILRACAGRIHGLVSHSETWQIHSILGLLPTLSCLPCSGRQRQRWGVLASSEGVSRTKGRDSRMERAEDGEEKTGPGKKLLGCLR